MITALHSTTKFYIHMYTIEHIQHKIKLKTSKFKNYIKNSNQDKQEIIICLLQNR